MGNFRASIELIGLEELLLKLSPAVAAESGKAALKAMRDGAILIEADAKRHCPVDEGALRRSITHSESYLKSSILVIDIGTNVEYASFVEFGTGRRGAAGHSIGQPITETARKAMAAIGYVYGAGKKRPGSPGMAARPFLFPAFEKYRDKIKELMIKAVVRAIEEGKK